MSAAALAALSGLPSGACAETRLIDTPNRYLVIPVAPATSQHLNKGDALLDVPLRWRSAAVLSVPIQLTADERLASLAQGQSLPETSLQFDDPQFGQSVAFCVPRLADPVRKNPLLAMGVLGAMLARSTTDGQFCLVDRDRDGIADHSVLINAGSPAARAPVAIAGVPYKLTPGAPVSEGDSFKITYRGGRNFEMAIIQQGHPRYFDTLSFRGPHGRVAFNRWLRAVKKADGSVEVAAPGITFTGRDYSAQSIDVEWPIVAEAIALPIPDDVKGVYRPY